MKELDEEFGLYAKSRNVELRNLLVAEHLPLAAMVARRYAGRGIEYDDLYQVAAMALVGAVERFEPGKGLKFSSFAVPTLAGVIRNHFRDKSRLVRLPRRANENLLRIDSAGEKLAQTLGRDPSPQEIAAKTGLSLEEVLETLEARGLTRVSSIDAEIAADEETSLLAFLGQEEEEYERIAMRDMIEKELSALPAEHRAILERRFFEGLSQRQVAESLNVSQMYISRIERKLLQRLKTAFLGP
ncbi:MAG: sigma-70 family RNA polymerase sigma factor [Christensenellaceae bacterium]|jgi:RNA polymerase sigma-B factor|nr:sigma-70 family RNA polymerase sigma factor [Christensenellaceae bacterium]